MKTSLTLVFLCVIGFVLIKGDCDIVNIGTKISKCMSKLTEIPNEKTKNEENMKKACKMGNDVCPA